jgi:glycosyltransferase involved in cell wall biosynthesis
MEGRPRLISIITPAYNRAKTLGRTLDSYLSQTYPDWECLLVDDGSTDETAAVIARYDDPRIHVYRHPVNKGVTAAMNTGLDNIHGEWFTTNGSDDELVPEALAIVLEVAERTGATSVLTNCLNAETGEMTGIGPDHEGWLTPKEAASLRGDHWGITQTSLLGDLRFNERLPTVGRTVWMRLHLTARRYYIDQALCVVHSDGSERVTKRRLSLRQKVDVYGVLSEEREYLDALRQLDPSDYRRTMTRIWAARVLDPFIPRG